MRISKKFLEARVWQLNDTLGQSNVVYGNDPQTGTMKWSIGSFILDKNNTGYQLEQVWGETGGTVNITARLSGQEMSLFITGLFCGIGLRNNQLGEMIRKSNETV
jgi:hypothetical protein